MERSGEGAGIGEGGPFIAGGSPPLPAARARDGSLREWLRLPMVAAPVDLVPDGLINGRAGPAEDSARDAPRRGVRESTQAGFPPVLASSTAGSPAGGGGGRPSAADSPPRGCGAGGAGGPDSSVAEPAGDGGSGDDCRRVAGSPFDLEDNPEGRQGGPRGPPPR